MRDPEKKLVAGRRADAKRRRTTKRRQQNAESRKRYRDWLDSLKDSPCTDCGQSYPACIMHFHHVQEKSFNIGDARSNKMGRAAVLAEIRKCILLCANCHGLRTWRLQ